MTVLSFTSYPTRFQDPRFLKVLNALVAQRNAVKDLHVCFTVYVKDLPQLPQEVIEVIEKNNIELLISNVNHKVFLKFLLAAEKYGEVADIITVDDDMVYIPSFVFTMLAAAAAIPQCVLGGRVHQITYDENGNPRKYKDWNRSFDKCVAEPRDDLMVTGVGGALYPKGFFNQENFGLACILAQYRYTTILLPFQGVDILINQVTLQALFLGTVGITGRRDNRDVDVGTNLSLSLCLRLGLCTTNGTTH